MPEKKHSLIILKTLQRNNGKGGYSMNKLRSLVCAIVVFCTMSTISYAKSEVRRSETQDGTKEKPFVLSMGDGIIDVYYADENAKENDKESYKDFY